MLKQMTIVIANETDASTVERIGIAVKNVHASALLYNHNFIEIMMMLRKLRLRSARLNGNRCIARREKINTVQNRHRQTPYLIGVSTRVIYPAVCYGSIVEEG